MKISIEVETKTLDEPLVLEYCFVLWKQLPGNSKRDARKHFEERFKVANLAHTQPYLTKVLDGATHLGDEAWAIVIHDADGENKNKIAAALRKRWLECCEKRAMDSPSPR